MIDLHPKRRASLGCWAFFLVAWFLQAFVGGTALSAEDHVDLAGGGNPIVIVGDGTMLKSGMERCLGIEVKLVRDPNYSPASGEIPIYIGDSPLAREAIGKRVDDLDPEGYIIQVERDRIFLYATQPATDTGSPTGWVQFDFLRRFLGVDHYFPGPLGEVYPKQDKLEVPIGVWVESPAFLHRHWSGYAGRANGWRLRSSGGGGRFHFHHNFWKILPVAKYSNHPEYYPVIYDENSMKLKKGAYADLKQGERFVPTRSPAAGWQPCTSNPDVLKIVIDAAVAEMEKHPRSPVFSLGINDSGGHCHCPECLKETPPGVSPYSREADGYRMYQFYEKVAKGVLAKIPNARLGFLAYEALNSGIPKKLNPCLMPYVTMSMADNWDRDYKEKLWNRISVWGKTATHFGIYEWLFGQGYIIPRIYVHEQAEGLLRLQEMGCEGFYAEAYPNWGLDGPKLWVLEKLLWNPKQNVDKLIDQWCNGLFGSSGPIMRRYFDRLERAWSEQKPSKPDRGGYRLFDLPNKGRQLTEVFPPAVCDDAWSILLEAEKSAGDPEITKRILFFKSAFALTRYCSHRYNASQKALELSGSNLADVGVLRGVVSAYSDWLEIGSIESLLDDLQEQAPLAFQDQAQQQVTGKDFKPGLRAWDTDFPLQTKLGQAILDLALTKVSEGALTKAAIDAAIGETVEGLSESPSIRKSLASLAGGLVVTALPTTVPLSIEGEARANWGAPSYSGEFYVYPSLSKRSSLKTDVWVRYDDNFLYVAAQCHQPQELFGSIDIGRDNVPVKSNGGIDVSNYQQNFPYMYPHPKKGVTSCNSFGVSLQGSFYSLVTAEGSLFDANAGGGGLSPNWNGSEAVAKKTPDGWVCLLRIHRKEGHFASLVPGEIVKQFNLVRVAANQKSAFVPGKPRWWAIEPLTGGCLLIQ